MVERDDLLLLALTLVPIIAYLMLLYIQAQPIFAIFFDAILFIAAFVMLFQLKDEHSEGILKFDENLTPMALVLGFGLGFATFILNVAVFSYSSPDTLLSLIGKQLSVVYVPDFLSVANLPVLSLGVAAISVLLVAVAEEGLKADSIFGAFIPLQEKFGEDSILALVISVVWGIGLWAVLHTIKAGFGWEQVTMAFISGSIWMAGWLATKSILVPIAAHGSYDFYVISLTNLAGAVAVEFVVAMTVLAALTMGLYAYSRMSQLSAQGELRGLT